MADWLRHSIKLNRTVKLCPKLPEDHSRKSVYIWSYFESNDNGFIDSGAMEPGPFVLPHPGGALRSDADRQRIWSSPPCHETAVSFWWYDDTECAQIDVSGPEGPTPGQNEARISKEKPWNKTITKNRSRAFQEGTLPRGISYINNTYKRTKWGPRTDEGSNYGTNYRHSCEKPDGLIDETKCRNARGGMQRGREAGQTTPLPGAGNLTSLYGARAKPYNLKRRIKA